MTEDQELILGQQARALLLNDTFTGAVAGFMNLHLDALLASDDDDRAGRERHFRQMRCYENVLADLQARVDAADKIEAARASETANDEDEDI